MRRVTTAHIALAIAATIYAVQARAFEVAPFELPEPFTLEAPCLPAECVELAVARYQHCILWPLLDGDVEAASRCAVPLTNQLDCCAGIAAPGVICP